MTGTSADDLDLPAFVALNNDAVPAVTPLDLADAEHLLEIARRVVARPEGVVILLGPGADYDSANYGWFSDRYPDFLYVDRIIVAPAHRGAGVGARLYAEVFGMADDAGLPVLAEVNLEPPNPGSSAFHRRCGFEQVGTLEHREDYVVEMLCRAPDPAGVAENAEEGRPWGLPSSR